VVPGVRTIGTTKFVGLQAAVHAGVELGYAACDPSRSAGSLDPG
jgi:hypothetical protein